jgi:hypothetical protein
MDDLADKMRIGVRPGDVGGAIVDQSLENEEADSPKISFPD